MVGGDLLEEQFSTEHIVVGNGAGNVVTPGGIDNYCIGTDYTLPREISMF